MHSIFDQQTIKQTPPTAILCGNYQYVVCYPEELVVISLITKVCQFKTSNENLIQELLHSKDSFVNFNTAMH